MKVVIVNRSDARGGAAVVSKRLAEALRREGVETDMLVLEKLEGDAPWVRRVVGRWRAKIPFLLERLQVFLGNGRNRADLFKADTGGFGLPLHREPLVSEADVVCLAWVNQGMVSLREVERIAELGKPVVWIMHDMWCCTGVCHHAGDCEGFKGECGLCPLLGRKASLRDLSHRTWRRKRRMNERARVTYVAVSHWLKGRCEASLLLRNARVEVIGNPYNFFGYRPDFKGDTTIRVMIAAARLDDPIKGLDIFVDMAARLRIDYPEVAERLEFVAVGGLKNPDALKDFPLKLVQTGVLDGAAVSNLLRRVHIVVSTSLFETLPGTLVEGQAHGALPVAFDRGGQRDIITDGETGVLVPFGDDPAACMAAGLVRGVEIVDGTDWEVLQRRLVESVRAKFGASVIAGRYVSLFRELLGEKGAS